MLSAAAKECCVHSKIDDQKRKDSNQNNGNTSLPCRPLVRTKTVCLEVISCDPLLSSSETEAFKFRAADEEEHVGHKTFVPLPVPISTDSSKVEHWQLVRSTGSNSQALLLTRVGCLEKHNNNKVCAPASALL